MGGEVGDQCRKSFQDAVSNAIRSIGDWENLHLMGRRGRDSGELRRRAVMGRRHLGRWKAAAPRASVTSRGRGCEPLFLSPHSKFTELTLGRKTYKLWPKNAD